jgi:hypothetical protein
MTNQASEELRKAVRDGLSNHTGEFVNPWMFRKNYSHEELTDMLDDIMAGERLFKNLQALIRTEKLKLLAEVREQAGEYELNMHGFYDKNVSDKITAVPLEALTKLEAEL